MNYKVSSISLFDKQAKRLAKKYPSLKNDLAQLIESLVHEPQQGTSLGNSFFKIRLAIANCVAHIRHCEARSALSC